MWLPPPFTGLLGLLALAGLGSSTVIAKGNDTFQIWVKDPSGGLVMTNLSSLSGWGLDSEVPGTVRIDLRKSLRLRVPRTHIIPRSVPPIVASLDTQNSSDWSPELVLL